MEAKIIPIGNSLGIVLPKETLEQMNLHEGDIVEIVKSPVDSQLQIARKIMLKRKAVLKELAK